MKDSEFIELLNLYLDHEITPADAARLEAEVLGNPSRREVYRDYCRMQKGCKLLAQEFRTDAVPAGDAKVVAFETGRSRARRAGLYIAGGFAAAAACVAFIFVTGNPSRQSPSSSEPTFAQSAAPAAAKPASDAIAAAPQSRERTIPRTVMIPAGQDVQPRLVNALTLAGTSAGSQNALMSSADQTAAPFDWINRVQLPPVQRVSIEDFRFDGRSPLRQENRSYAAPRAPQGAMEWNAIRYQK